MILARIPTRLIRMCSIASAYFILVACAGGGESASSAEDKDREVIPYGFDIMQMSYLECPLTKQKLRLAKQGEIDNLNKAIEELSLGDLQGQPVRGLLRGLLIREDGQVAYPIQNGEALLNEAAAIDLVKPAKSDPNRFNNMGRR